MYHTQVMLYLTSPDVAEVALNVLCIDIPPNVTKAPFAKLSDGSDAVKVK
jgi:hypothetical protein